MDYIEYRSHDKFNKSVNRDGSILSLVRSRFRFRWKSPCCGRHCKRRRLAVARRQSSLASCKQKSRFRPANTTTIIHRDVSTNTTPLSFCLACVSLRRAFVLRAADTWNIIHKIILQNGVSPCLFEYNI